MGKRKKDPELEAFLAFLHIDEKNMKYHGKSKLHGFHVYTDKKPKKKKRLFKLFWKKK